jgi:hypothetical protein
MMLLALVLLLVFLLLLSLLCSGVLVLDLVSAVAGTHAVEGISSSVPTVTGVYDLALVYCMMLLTL